MMGLKKTVSLLAEKVEELEHESDGLNRTFLNIVNGGAAITRGTLEGILEGKGYEKVASITNDAVAKNTIHFSDLGSVGKLAGGGEVLIPMLPEVTSEAVRTGARYLPSFLGSLVDYNVQVHIERENTADAAIKVGAHGLISAAGGAIGYLGSEGFYAIYDNADKIWEGTKGFVGDAVSGLTNSLGTIFG